MKNPPPPPRTGMEIDVSDVAEGLQTDAQNVIREETDAAEAEGLSEDEAFRRVAAALSNHSYRDERGNVAPIPNGLRQRMAARMGCPPDEVDRLLGIREAVDRVSELVLAITDALEQERNAIEEEIQNGASISDEDARLRLLSAHERGCAAGLQKLREGEVGS